MNETVNQVLSVTISVGVIIFGLYLSTYPILSWNLFWINWLLFLGVVFIGLCIYYSFSYKTFYEEDLLIFYDFNNWRKYLSDIHNDTFSKINKETLTDKFFPKEEIEKWNKEIRDRILNFNKIYAYFNPRYSEELEKFLLEGDPVEIRLDDGKLIELLDDKNPTYFPVVIKNGIKEHKKLVFNPRYVISSIKQFTSLVKELKIE